MAVYVTGDTHGDFSRISKKNFPVAKTLTCDDFVIIAGDFGGVFAPDLASEQYWLKWLDNYPATICFVDGNHENFDLLEQMPVVEFCGGMAHQVSSNIYHLMRGEMYEMCGKKFFVFGGASSHDFSALLDSADPQLKQKARYCRSLGILYRIRGKNWWMQEVPSEQEYEHALNTLEKHGGSADFVITHDAPERIVEKCFGMYARLDRTNEMLSEIDERIICRRWYFGHHHTDLDVDDRFSAVYRRIIRVV